MKEALLQFIWQYSLYEPSGLRTMEGEPVTVIHPGALNTHAGPDFLNARVRVGDTTLAGHVEIHINSSDWLKHGHQHDEAYKNLILHLVYTHDVALPHTIPTLQIGEHIPQHVIARYTSLMNANQSLPCAGMLAQVKDITKESWLTRLLAERWEMKLDEWNTLQKKDVDDWQNLLYWRMAANFGFKVNATPFLALARSLDINILAKHRDSLLQVEALLFGQAGMLEEPFTDEYPNRLRAEYQYLKKKYQLTPIASYHWKFLRMRPANFPTIRIAQFAALVHRSVHLFSQIIELYTVKEIAPLLQVVASSYWDNHFIFDEQSPHAPKHLGRSSVQNIIINTIAPIQFLFARRHRSEAQQERALQLLEDLPSERNHIITTWNETGWNATNAAQSQALIHLYNHYCQPRQCLNCAIGLSILK